MPNCNRFPTNKLEMKIWKASNSEFGQDGSVAQHRHGNGYGDCISDHIGDHRQWLSWLHWLPDCFLLMPDYRIRRIKEDEKNKTDKARKAPFLGKWLWIIFWLIIPSTIGSLMTQETVVKLLPGLEMPGQLIKAVCTLTYGAILLFPIVKKVLDKSMVLVYDMRVSES